MGKLNAEGIMDLPSETIAELTPNSLASAIGTADASLETMQLISQSAIEAIEQQRPEAAIQTLRQSIAYAGFQRAQIRSYE
jgi:hypothetical protein